MKVVELVMAQRAHGWSPEEISFQYPHLSMAQIHSALAYYWDHQEELDRDVERRMSEVDATRAATPSPLAERLANDGNATAPRERGLRTWNLGLGDRRVTREDA